MHFNINFSWGRQRSQWPKIQNFNIKKCSTYNYKAVILQVTLEIELFS